MEGLVDIEGEKGELEESLLDSTSSKSKGGLRTLPFILANEGFERAASYGLQPNMIVYLMDGYGFDMATGSNVLFLWAAAANFTPIFAAFLADSYVGRFRMIGFGSVLNFMGMLLLFSTSVVPGAKPYCDNKATTNTCTSTPFQLLLLGSSFALMSIGAGGIRSSTMAFGADQVVNVEDQNSTPSHSRVIENVFNLYYFAISFALLFALTFVVYIQERFGWQVGFGVPVVLMLISVVSFFLASCFYVKAKPKASFLTNIGQVIVASWRNRHYEFPTQKDDEQVCYCIVKDSRLRLPSKSLRFLNKACIVKDPEEELNEEGIAMNPWNICTIDQVEEFKSIINIIPMWSTGIMFSVCVNQTSFRVIQANAMDRHIFSTNFELPSGSFGTFALIAVILWLFLYDRVIIPLMSKLLGQPFRLDSNTRMATGFLLSFLSMVISGVVESVRRDMATKGNGSLNSPSSVNSLSALWLVPHICLLGLGEALTAIAQIELFYSELPKSMSCIASNLYGLGVGMGSLVASVIVSLVDHVSKRGGNESWVSSDINKGHYDYYYWFLSGLSLLNFLYFLLCSKAYGWSKNVSDNKKGADSEGPVNV